MVETARSNAQAQAEMVAIQALSYIAADGERLGRFLAVTGIDPGEIRAAAREPLFLAGVLDYLSNDERSLLDFAAQVALDPQEVAHARRVLAGARGADD
jgi:hypothetical protein